MSEAAAPPLRWTRDFEPLDGHAPAAAALARLRQTSVGWFVVVRFGGHYLYVFSRAELLDRLAAADAPGAPAVPLETALKLHEDQGSRKARPGDALAPPAPQDGALPSRARFVEIGDDGAPVAVGGSDIDPAPRRMRGRPQAAPQVPQPPRQMQQQQSQRQQSQPPPAAAALPPPAPHSADDEGTAPQRYPSIDADRALRPGDTVSFTVDLLLQASPTTGGDAIAFAALPGDWDTWPVGVTLLCAGIDFADGGEAQVTMRRNRASVAATISGTVSPRLKAGDTVEVHAQFWQGTRCCGNGKRVFGVADARAALAPPPQATSGSVALDPQAEPPDLTVYIALFDPDMPSRLHWRLVTPTFDTLPPKLTGVVTLGSDPRSEAAALFKEFAVLKRGQHKERIDGFGERLWKRAPPEFHAAYWALVDHYRRPLTIQFVSDDPHLPWELMRPSRPGEKHEPIALTHAVARWIGAYQGLLRRQLPAGEMLVMAPRYSQLAAQLTQAEATAQRVLDDAATKGYAARALPGTRSALLGVLETPPPAPVALLYFTGHGLFNDAMPSASAIKLEKGESLAADEVDRDEVALGARDGTVVFFNACEVGATAGAIGEVGGWAGALLGRRFRAFIAPLWAVDEEDASQATLELIERIVVQRQPIGAALRDLRRQHGAVSPTFYSYILYGDVTARFGA